MHWWLCHACIICSPLKGFIEFKAGDLRDECHKLECLQNLKSRSTLGVQSCSQKKLCQKELGCQWQGLLASAIFQENLIDSIRVKDCEVIVKSSSWLTA